jgi:hypothetical protein
VLSSSANQHLSQQKLKVFLKKFGQYPLRYRPLVWRYLLQLPENESAFSALCQRQSHSGLDQFNSLHKVADRRVSERLQTVCRLVAFWSPVFAEVDYLPQLVFPFSVVFGSDEMSCLEAVMTVLLWFGHSWQATYPSPPIHITDAYDRLLEYHDHRLYKHLYSLGLSPGPLLWQILSTFYSEILPSEIWLCVMDRIFTDIRDINFVYLVPLAIVRLVRVSLLSTAEKRHVLGFLREPQSITISALLKMVSEMKKSTPSHLLSCTSHHSLDDIKQLSAKTSPDLDKTRAHISISSQEGKPLFPLPKGQYPAYDGYPAHLLDWQVQERSRVLAMKKEIELREDTLLELEQHIQKVRISVILDSVCLCLSPSVSLSLSHLFCAD